MNLRLYFCEKTYSTPKCLTWYTNQRVTSFNYELLPLRVVFFALVTSYELLFIARITSYLLHTSYKLHFIARVTSYCMHASYELLLIARVTSYLFHACYELPFIVRVTLLKVFLLHYHWPVCKKLTEWRRVYQHEEKKIHWLLLSKHTAF